MAKKPAKKSAKSMGRKQMKKTKGGAGGGVWVAAGDVNGDGSAINGGTLTNNVNGGITGNTISGNTWAGKRSFTGGV